MSARRRLLFVSPVMPAASGNGLAMRAGLFLEALAMDHDVALLVVPVADPADRRPVPAFVRRRATEIVVLPLAGREDTLFGLIARLRDPAERAAALRAYPKPVPCRFATSAVVREAAARWAGARFDAVHVMRLYMTPYARPFVEGKGGGARPTTWLDLDDIEPDTHRGLATLHALRGDARAAELTRAEADKYAALAREYVPMFDWVLACSERDAATVPPRAAVVPNAVPIPPAATRIRAAAGFRFLFVGTLSYLPNLDAAEFFCREVLPGLHDVQAGPVSVRLVGANPPPAVRGLGEQPGVVVVGPVRTVRPWYARADAAVVPLRAGGGTRIKVLEAFAHRVPVVSTGLGAEGLDAEDGRHLLVGDGADGLEHACRRLMAEPRLGDRLAAHAYELVSSRYAWPLVAQAIRDRYRDG